MDDKEVEEMMNRIVADTIIKILTIDPTDIAGETTKYTEKTMAYIELHEDVLDRAYEMSKEYREYE
tara:strand:- start:367 stop:564 length:198 start_codon:yes stop_codon:yes gene_type:complete